MTKTLSARGAAVRTLCRIDEDGDYATDLLSELSRHSALPADLYPTVQQWVRGVLENASLIDSRLEQRLKGKGLKGLPPEIRAILRVGAYQIGFLDRAPVPLVINESVNESRQLGFEGLTKLVNAVLRRISEIPKDGGARSSDDVQSLSEIATTTSHPKWLVSRWAEQFGLEEAAAICRADNERAPLCFRVNTLRSTAEVLQRELAAEEVETRPARFAQNALEVLKLPRQRRIHELTAFKQGLFLIQDESSILVTEMANAVPGMRVIDLCSAPGGKCCGMAITMGNTGKVVACDADEKRLERVKENCDRLGITNVEIVVGDARTLNVEPADLVLVDAPCSGLGTVGRRADLRWNKHEDDFPKLVELQKQILDHAAHLVKVGGRLVYSTCSIDLAENEIVANSFVQNRPNFTIFRDVLPMSAGLVTMEGYLRTFPHRHQMSGAFSASFVRLT